MHWSSGGNGWERQLRKGLMKTSFVGYYSASCCFKCIPVYIVSVAALSLAFLGPLLDPLAEIRMFGIAVVLPWLGCWKPLRHKQSLQPSESLPQRGLWQPQKDIQSHGSQLHNDALGAPAPNRARVISSEASSEEFFADRSFSALLSKEGSCVSVSLNCGWIKCKETRNNSLQEGKHPELYVVRLACCIRDSSVRPYRQLLLSHMFLGWQFSSEGQLQRKQNWKDVHKATEPGLLLCNQ